MTGKETPTEVAIGTIHIPDGSDEVFHMTKDGWKVHEEASKDLVANKASIAANPTTPKEEN